MALSGTAHFIYDHAYLGLINFEQIIAVIWDADRKA